MSSGRFYALRNARYARLLMRTPLGFVIVFGGVVVGTWLIATRVELAVYESFPAESRGDEIAGTAPAPLLERVGVGGPVNRRPDEESAAQPATPRSWEPLGDGTGRFVLRRTTTGLRDATVVVELPVGRELLLSRLQRRALGPSQ